MGMAKIYQFPLSPERQIELYYEEEDQYLYDDYYYENSREVGKKQSRLKKFLQNIFCD